MGKPAKVDQKVRAFDSPILEVLSRTHPAVPASLWIPILLALVYLGYRAGLSGSAVAAWVVGGLFAWTLIEYILHRWLFHWVPASPALMRAFYPVHQLHHDFQEWDRLVAPPLLSIPMSLLLFTLFAPVLGIPTVFPFFSGLILGYLAYDYVHLYTHFARPRSRIGKGLRRRHLQHHFAYTDRWYGVSSPLWDYVFRTHVAPGTRPRRV